MIPYLEYHSHLYHHYNIIWFPQSPTPLTALTTGRSSQLLCFPSLDPSRWRSGARRSPWGPRGLALDGRSNGCFMVFSWWFNGGLMGFDGGLMVMQWHFLVFDGVWGWFMVIYGDLMAFYCAQWGFNGISWWFSMGKKQQKMVVKKRSSVLHRCGQWPMVILWWFYSDEWGFWPTKNWKALKKTQVVRFLSLCKPYHDQWKEMIPRLW